MTSPFLTINIFIINMSVMLLTTSLVGAVMTVLWLIIGKLLEKAGFVNIVFELLKMAVFFFCFPLVYILLKVFEVDLGRGYLFFPTKQILIYSTMFLIIWCLGTIFMLVYILHDVHKLQKKYADMFPCDLETQKVFCDVLQELCLIKKAKCVRLQLRQSYRAQVPCIIGIIHPTIILPVKKYSQAELTHILMHELIHYKQRDILLKRVSIIVCIIHFYNPISWLLLVEIQRWSEFACDFRVCQNNRKIHEYFEVLMSNAAREGGRSRLASHLVENQHELVERARKMKILYGKKRSKLKATAILCVAFVLSTMTVCAATQETSKQYVQLNQQTSEEIFTSEMLQGEEYTEQGDAENIQAIPGTVDTTARSTNSINWQVNKRTKMYGPYFEAFAGEFVSVIVSIQPSNVNVRVGIEDSTGLKRYTIKSGSVTHIFQIDHDDDYFFYVENTGDTAVTVTGSYVTP